MSFTGKATYSSGTTLPEGAEDMSDIIAIISPDEAPLLDALGDPLREATSTHHEWLEDAKGNRKERVCCGNYTQVFSGTIEVNFSDTPAIQMGLAEEMDFQEQEKLRELLRDLENAVINGCEQKPVGFGPTRHMLGIRHRLQTNVMNSDSYAKELDESIITAMLRQIWENSSGNVDLIVVGGAQRRKINAFCVSSYSDGWLYESEFGVCRIVVSRWMPHDAVLFLDSSRINVLPLAGRSFHYSEISRSSLGTASHIKGEIIGEYTLELKNEAAHGIITGLST